jgi:hypothetical protein
MESSEIPKQSNRARWIVVLALLAWLWLIVVWAHRVHVTSFQMSAWNVRSSKALLGLMWDVAWGAFARFAMFVPVGFLVALALPLQETLVARIVRRWLPAVVGSLLLAVVVLGFAAKPGFEAPAVLYLILPWSGCLVGCWAGMAWSRGKTERWLLIPELALLATLVGAGIGILFILAIDSQPLQLDTPAVTSAEKRRLYSLFSGKNPLKIEQGRTVEVSLTEQDINLLLAWGLSIGDSARRARVKLQANRAELLASMPIPGRSRYLNIDAQGSVSCAQGRFNMRADGLRIGRVEVPVFMLRTLSRIVSSAANDDERVRSILQVVKGIGLNARALTLTYGHGAPPKGFIASLFHDSVADQVDIPVIRAQILNLIASAGTMPQGGDDRFGAAVQTAFRFARERSSPNRAVQENRNALLALGIMLGHHRVETLIGRFMDDSTRAAVKRSFQGTTLRKREDWPKHFFVSAALTVIAAGNVSDATGLFKEEKDARGGSGFSFGDLLADRSGTTFAEVATRNEQTARALQDRLARDFNVDDYFPEAQDLPENLQDAEFRARYGGVGGEGYRRLMAEIERRIARCTAYSGRAPSNGMQ